MRDADRTSPSGPARPSAAASGPAAHGARRTRVLVVDDSAFMRRAMSQMLGSDPGLEVIDTAANGREGLDKALALRPDVVTLDIEMPVMDGLTALRRIRAEVSPPPAVLVCSSLTSAGSHEALKALRLGAADVIAKDGSAFSLGIEKIRPELLAKVKAIAAGRFASVAEHAARAPARLDRGHRLDAKACDLVVVGSSTGGPPVLETILSALPADLPVPVVVAQHMPLLFTKSLAERLDQECAITVLHAEPRMTLAPGCAYIAPGGSHTRVLRSPLGRMLIEVSPEPASALYKPSVNELFSSAARALGPRALAVILTGMGDDGMLGAKDLKARNAIVLAQDMPSCVVYGMPKAVAQAGCADASLPPEDLAAMLATLAPSSRVRAA